MIYWTSYTAATDAQKDSDYAEFNLSLERVWRISSGLKPLEMNYSCILILFSSDKPLTEIVPLSPKSTRPARIFVSVESTKDIKIVLLRKSFLE